MGITTALPHRRSLFRVLLSFALALAAVASLATPADAVWRNEKCVNKTFANGGVATMCAFLNQHDWNGNYAGVGRIDVDKGKANKHDADLTVKSVTLYARDKGTSFWYRLSTAGSAASCTQCTMIDDITGYYSAAGNRCGLKVTAELQARRDGSLFNETITTNALYVNGGC